MACKVLSYKERDHSLFLQDVSNQGEVPWRSQQEHSSIELSSRPTRDTDSTELTLMGQDYQHMGTSPSSLLYLVGKPQQTKLTKSKPASRGLPFKIFRFSRTQMHIPAAYTGFFFPVFTQKPCKTATCMQFALEAFACSELYGTSIITDVTSDSTWLAWREWDRGNLNWSVM